VKGATFGSTTRTRQWPAGSSGPFSESVGGLYSAKTYDFRVCGADDANGATSCGQTRQFTTRAPVNDTVTGHWGFSPHFNGSVDASSGPSGQDPQGTLTARRSSSAFEGYVTCVQVAGNKAVVGAVGHPAESPYYNQTALFTVVDGGPSGTDTIGVTIPAGTSAVPDCASAQFDGENDGDTGLVVNDAP
jgi:hypothetical protein